MKIFWDENKAEINLKKHSVSFDEAKTVLYDFLAITVNDPLHTSYEERFITVGISSCNRLLVVVHTDCQDEVRIISARLASKNERRYYEGNN